METKAGSPWLPPVNQIGLVVKDCDKAAEYYSTVYGIGPFGIYDTRFKEATLYGKLAAPSLLRIGIARMGGMEIELIQVLEGGEFYKPFLQMAGEGLHHLGSYVKTAEEYDRWYASATSHGIKPALEYRGRRLQFTYFDTRAEHGVILEIMHMEGRQF
ncbi:MAG: VOC family protein [Chloroflexi bacterium]|nr:VOC family protein [Chloroflexota bacterium]